MAQVSWVGWVGGRQVGVHERLPVEGVGQHGEDEQLGEGLQHCAGVQLALHHHKGYVHLDEGEGGGVLEPGERNDDEESERRDVGWKDEQLQGRDSDVVMW